MPDNHALFTRMLFIDALVGLGIPNHEQGMVAEHMGWAAQTGDQHNEAWAWNRDVLETLPDDELQGLYVRLKYNEVTHAG